MTTCMPSATSIARLPSETRLCAIICCLSLPWSSPSGRWRRSSSERRYVFSASSGFLRFCASVPSERGGGGIST